MRIRSASDIVERFRANWEGYARECRVFLILTVLAALADAIYIIRDCLTGSTI